eukprot:710331-Prorocentrum_minimum.AAC.1
MTAYSFHLRAVLLEIDGERGPAAEASITVAAQRPARPSTSGVYQCVSVCLSVFVVLYRCLSARRRARRVCRVATKHTHDGREKSKTGLQSRD